MSSSSGLLKSLRMTRWARLAVDGLDEMTLGKGSPGGARGNPEARSHAAAASLPRIYRFLHVISFRATCTPPAAKDRQSPSLSQMGDECLALAQRTRQALIKKRELKIERESLKLRSPDGSVGGYLIGFGSVLSRSRLFVFTRPLPIISVFILSSSSSSDSLEAWSGWRKILCETRQGSMKSMHK